jgi:hypothetical protein
MLTCLWSGSTICRLLFREISDFLFEPIEFDFQLTDLVIEIGLQEIGLQLLTLFILPQTAILEDGGQSLKHLFLPLGDLIGVHLKPGRNLINGLLTFESFKRHLGFELCAITLSLRFHLPPVG